jgi:hypothetical protein
VDELEQVIAGQVREAMRVDGQRQEDLAKAMAVLGFSWSSNRVAQVVTGRGALSLLEIAGLCAAFGRKLPDLLGDPTSDVQLPAGTPIRIEHVRDALVSGDSGEWERSRKITGTGALTAGAATLSGAGTVSDATVKAARRLGVAPRAVEVASAQLWGRSFSDERDHRVEPRADETKRQLQARRGHVTRTLLAELGSHFSTTDADR